MYTSSILLTYFEPFLDFLTLDAGFDSFVRDCYFPFLSNQLDTACSASSIFIEAFAISKLESFFAMLNLAQTFPYSLFGVFLQLIF